MNKKLPFVKYWFVWNGWCNVHGRESECVDKSCFKCSHRGKIECTAGISNYCKLHNIQIKLDLICDKFDDECKIKTRWEVIADILNEEEKQREMSGTGAW